MSIKFIKEFAYKLKVTYSAMAFRFVDVVKNDLAMLVTIRQINNDIRKFYYYS